MSTELKIVITTKNTAGSGTTHRLLVSAIFEDSNLSQLGGGMTGQGQTMTNTFLVPEEVAVIRSLSIMLNGLAPGGAPDNWRTSHVKVTFGTEVLVDRAWELLFDNDNRSHELYRRAFDLTRGGGDEDGKIDCGK